MILRVLFPEVGLEVEGQGREAGGRGLFPLACLCREPVGEDPEFEVVGQPVAEQEFPLVDPRRVLAGAVEPHGGVLDVNPSLGKCVRTVGEVGGIGVRVADVDFQSAFELVLDGLLGIWLGEQPAVFEDQVHERREEERVVLRVVNTEAVVIAFGRVSMDVGVVELRHLARPDRVLDPVAETRIQAVQ